MKLIMSLVLRVIISFGALLLLFEDISWQFLFCGSILSFFIIGIHFFTIRYHKIPLSNVLNMIIGILSVFYTFSILSLSTIEEIAHKKIEVVCLMLLFYLFLGDITKVISSQQKKKESKRIRFYIFFSSFFLSSLLYLWAFYPGILVPDSINQWNQIHSSIPWNDWHPVGHTMMIKIMTYFGDQLVTFVLFQVIFYSFVMGQIFDFLQGFLSKKMVVSFLLYFTLVPIFPLSSIYVVKDSLYTYFLVWNILLLIKIISSKGIWLRGKFNLLMLMISILGVLFFRHNGWPVFLVSIFILALFFRKGYLRFYLISILCIGIYLFTTGPIYSHFKVIQSDPTESFGIFVQISAAVIKHDGNISLNEEKYLYSIMDEKDWKELYDPRDVDKIKFKERFDKEILKENPRKFLLNALSLSIKNPVIALKAYLLQTEILWHTNMELMNMRPIFRKPLIGKQGPFYFMRQAEIKKYKPDYKGMVIQPSKYQNNYLNRTLSQFLKYIEEKGLYLFLMPALYFCIFMFSLIVLWWQGAFKLTLAFTPFLLNLGTMFVAIPAQDVRYAFPNYFIAFISFALAWGYYKNAKDQKIEGNEKV
ncbi:DUF6020 family protein [Enterococcus massiliensis]|uniref:DUF6020 family protein n=1 Tax=Enterococcus massiliensis TaxID=1640685 RepID=UPI00065DC462|nr:DUF6020 family protein [Enterococcus massiliensis]